MRETHRRSPRRVRRNPTSAGSDSASPLSGAEEPRPRGENDSPPRSEGSRAEGRGQAPRPEGGRSGEESPRPEPERGGEAGGPPQGSRNSEAPGDQRPHRRTDDDRRGRRRRRNPEPAGEPSNAGANGRDPRRRRRDPRRVRQEGIRDATATRMAAAEGRTQRGGNRRSPMRQERQAPRRKGLEILRLLQQQVSIDPFERFQLETTPDNVSMRIMELITPIGRGQRALIVSPPKAGKTTLLTQVANSITTNHPDVKVYALLVDERPEEVTHFRRSTTATVFAASSDMSTREHISTAEECMNTVVEPVLAGEDVVLVLDSITRLARAYNSVQGNSGRTLSGGLDANTMLAPRQIFGAARKIEDGGSLTILGTALVDTGSRMDEVIFQEFKGTGNTELVLSRDLFEKRIFPCVDISKSGTRKEEKLYPPEMVSRLYNLRRLAAQYPPDKAMQGILKLMQRHATNEELLKSLAGLE